MSNYYTGTVAVTNGSYIVTGTGTSFITRGIMAGDRRLLNSRRTKQYHMDSSAG